MSLAELKTTLAAIRARIYSGPPADLGVCYDRQRQEAAALVELASSMDAEGRTMDPQASRAFDYALELARYVGD